MPRTSVKVLGECDNTAAPSLRGPAEAENAPSESPSAAMAATVIRLIDISQRAPHLVYDPFSAKEERWLGAILIFNRKLQLRFCSCQLQFGRIKRGKAPAFIVRSCTNTQCCAALRYRNWIFTTRRIGVQAGQQPWRSRSRPGCRPRGECLRLSDRGF